VETVSGLKELLARMSPELEDGTYYLASVDSAYLMNLANYLDCIRCIYREEEGLTVLFSEEIKAELSELTKDVAGPFAIITLKVNSDLMAIGFLAKITKVLADEKISVNAFSAYHHDHLLVPYEKKDDAMKALRELRAKEDKKS
jgi:hypothetical protein